MEIISKYHKFLDIYTKDENGRFRSFDHIHTVFQEREKYSLDEIALHLFAFMGSWGMFRNSFLMQKDYKFLIPIVEILCDKRYSFLLDINPLHEEFRKQKYISSIFEIKERIEDFVSTQKYYKDGRWEIISVTDTFVTKILLATFACMPALDNQVRAGLKKCHKAYTYFGEGILKDILDFANEHRDALLEAQCEIKEETNLEYPIMKIIDMCLWEYGAE